ncbi:unnamed protein product [Adineta ricciae]|uniref:G-protein coupled receptors family 1 profile domain-containing protein n=1 Tax=Adineta ricciae TaxID=249248 RepID=A0A815RR56_ADIRI|nr:unnamed protein product [Adineta ricciae]
MSSSNDTSVVASSAIIVALNLIKERFTGNLPLIFLILGSIGFLGNTFTFLQRNLRSNTFCIYSLCGSVVDVINLYTNLLMAYIAKDSNALSNITSRTECKTKLFLAVFLPQLSMNLLVTSLIDRFSCTCSLTSPIRRMRQLKMVPYLVALTILISGVMSLYSPVFYDYVLNSGCVVTDTLSNGILYTILHGFITPIVMFVFAWLTYRNVRQSRQRVTVANTSATTNRSRHQFISTVVTQVCVTSFLTLQWIGVYLYWIVTRNANKTADQWAIFYFTFSLSNNLYYLINVKSFYLSTLTSRLFRQALIRGLFKNVAMVLKLRELLIKQVAIHLPYFSYDSCQCLTADQRERVLRWLVSHDYLSPTVAPYITKNLLSIPLYSLEFYKCDQLTNDMLIEIGRASHFSRLKSLIIHQCSQVQDSGVRAITKGQLSLEYVALRKLANLTDVGLDGIHSAFLKEIDFRWNEKIQDHGIFTIVSNNLNLRSIRLVNCHRLTGQSVNHIAQNLAEKLEVLDVEGLKTLDAEVFVHLVDYCPNIRSLNLFGIINLDADGLFTLFVRSTRMMQLNLSYTTCFLQEPVADYLCCLPLSLVDICLSGTQVYSTHILVRALTRLKNIEHLRLNGLATISDDAIEKILAVIGGRLKTLEMNGYITVGSLTDRSVEHIVRYCTSLEHLSLNLLSFTSTLDSLYELFSSTGRASKLHTISLSSFRNINERVLWSLAENCLNVTLLELSGIPCVNDALISSLKHCRKLSHLNIKGCKQITDLSICDLLGVCRFVSLVLSGCYQLTDKSILALAHTQPFLEEIYISGCTRISPAAVRFLQDNTIRRLYIDHKIPNALPDAMMARNLDTGLFEQV